MDIEVSTSRLRKYAEKERKIKRELDKINNSLRSCQVKLKASLSGSSSGSIGDAIMETENLLQNASEKVGRLAEGLDNVVVLYERTEGDIFGNIPKLEMVKEASNYIGPVSGYENVLKLLGIDTETAGQLAGWLSILSAISKTTDDNTAINILGPLAKYANSLRKFLSGDRSGYTGAEDFFGFAENSGNFLNALYNFLDEKAKKRSGGTGLGMGGIASYANVFASISGIAGEITKAMQNQNKSFAEVVSDLCSIGSEGTGLAEAAFGIIAKGKGVAEAKIKGAGGWFTFAEMLLDITGQTFKSYTKYSADGEFSFEDVNETAMDASVKGLTTIASGITLGIINIDSDYVTQSLKDWGTDLATGISECVLKNKEMKEKVQDGNAFECAYGMGYGCAVYTAESFSKAAGGIKNFFSTIFA